MTSQLPVRQEPPRISEEQRRTWESLRRLIGQGAADFFVDACALMSMSAPLRTRPMLVAHLTRELESALRDVVLPVADRTAIGSKGAGVDKHKQEIKAILRALSIDDTHELSAFWLTLAGKDNPNALHALAHRDALLGARNHEGDLDLFWQRTQQLLVLVLGKLDSRYLELRAQVDALSLAGKPSPSDLDKIKNQIPHSPVVLAYFFDKVTSPEWLGPLHEAGFFSRPWPADRDERTGSYRAVPWPHGTYLARMSGQASDEVLSIILSVPESDNIALHDGLAKAALGLPVESLSKDRASSVADKAVQWLDAQARLGLAGRISTIDDQLASLVSRLAAAGHSTAALSVVHSLLRIVPPEQTAGTVEAKATQLLSPRGIIPEWNYSQHAANLLPKILSYAGWPAFELVCDLLQDAFLSTSRSRDLSEDDYSWIIRPSIADHPQNSGHKEIINALITAVWDAGNQLFNTGAVDLKRVTDYLADRKLPVFKRIAMQLLSAHADDGKGLHTAWLSNKLYFEEHAYFHEYLQLLGAGFPFLAYEERRRILSWIDEGPPDQADNAKAEVAEAAVSDPRQSRARADHWRLRRLLPIADHLPAEWQKRLQELRDQYGEPDHPDFLVYSGPVVWGPAKVFGAEHLASLEDEALIAALRDWKPSQSFDGGQAEDLAQEIQNAARGHPEKFSHLIEQFTGLPAECMAGLLRGLAEAAKIGSPLDWATIVASAGGFFALPLGREARFVDFGREAKRALTNLIDEGLKPGAAEIPITMRTGVWQLIMPLTDDTDPEPHPTPDQPDVLDDPLLASLNTVRGAAMRLIGPYIQWVERHTQSTDQPPTTVQLDPEVLGVLERHLDPAVDEAPAVRSVYGQLLGHIHIRNPEWAKAHLARLFPADEASFRQWRAVWEGFIYRWRPHRNWLEFLSDEYRRAARSLRFSGVARSSREADNRLGEHIVTYYWWGALEIDDQGSLLNEFFENASDELRSNTIRFAGIQLSKAEMPIPDAVIERAVKLWRWRNDVGRNAPDRRSMAQELNSFGWMLTSRAIEGQTGLQLYAESLNLLGAEHLPSRDVPKLVEFIASAAERHPAEAMSCLSLAIGEGERLTWTVIGDEEYLRKALSAALGSANAEAKRIAREIVNRLASRGFDKFADLLLGGS